jgi:hypothetical protein
VINNFFLLFKLCWFFYYKFIIITKIDVFKYYIDAKHIYEVGDVKFITVKVNEKEINCHLLFHI